MFRYINQLVIKHSSHGNLSQKDKNKSESDHNISYDDKLIKDVRL